MITAEIRRKFLDFFRGRGHTVKDSFPLIPQDDPTLLFISAGMAPLKPYFLGTKTDMKRAATCQKCFRTTDIENVGYTARHHTFFEMLGNFSFGDYFKKDAIAWAWEFITRDLGLDSSRLFVSVHHSDDEALQIWNKDVGVPISRIVKLGDKDNFWTIGIGPSGPCSEIYIDQGPELSCGSPDCAPGCDCARYLEFWNLVFTQYNRSEDGTLTPLEKKNIDTGMGLERLAAILQGKHDNFENDVFAGIVHEVEALTNHRFSEGGKTRIALKVVSDHIRALSFAIADGALPGNEGRGYVLRKILRRASRFGFSYLGQEQAFLHRLVPAVARSLEVYPEIEKNREYIQKIVNSEEERFLQTLKTGSEMLTEFVAALGKTGNRTLEGAKAFLLHDTYGFPLDLTREICKEENIKVDEAGFNVELEKQRERGRANVVSAFVNFQAINPSDFPSTRFVGYDRMKEQAKVLGTVPAGDETVVITDVSPFYAASGGQVGDVGRIFSDGATFTVKSTEKTEEVILHRGVWDGTGRFAAGDTVTLEVQEMTRRSTMRNHTATHLLHKALQEALGNHVKQAGSMVAPDRLRFDFTHFQGIDHETLERIERRVNEEVLRSHPVITTQTSFKEAVSRGAMALFGEKYGDVVRLVEVGDFSKELCGGTHCSNASEIGSFSILSESSVASGVRRIEALTGEGALEHIREMRREERALAQVLDCDSRSLVNKASRLVAEMKELKKELEALKKGEVKQVIAHVRSKAKTVGRASVIVSSVDGLTVDEMKSMADELTANAPHTAVLLASGGEKASFVLKLTRDLVEGGQNAGKLVKEIAKVAGGSGGGRSDMATAGGKNPEKLSEALKVAEAIFQEAFRV